ncbi:MAG: M20/M25/M40 family metallo-hydrolase [Dehalococcoidia bacterium]
MDWNKINKQALLMLQEYLQINTSNPPGNEILATDFFEYHLKINQIEFQTFTTANKRKILYAKIKGNNSKKGLMLCSHSDVVPVEKDKWSIEPFGGKIRNNKIYGRGAIDMKSCTIMQFIAFLLLKKNNQVLNRDVIFCLVPDEEIGSMYGMSWLIKNKPELLNIEYSLNEGGYGFSDIEINNKPIFGIANNEKEICQLKITTFGETGHGSQPNFNNAPLKLTNALAKIHKWHNSNYQHVFSGNKQFFNAEENKKINDVELIAMNQITINITQLHTGNKHNVIPSKAEAILDCRLPGTINREGFITMIKKLLNNPEILVESISTDEKNMKINCEWDTELIKIIQSTINKKFPESKIFPLTSAYATDNRFLRNIGINAYGFIPSLFSAEERNGFHNHDEYITIDNFYLGCEMTYSIISQLCIKIAN